MKVFLSSVGLLVLAACNGAGTSSKIASADATASGAASLATPTFQTVTTCLTTDFGATLPAVNWDIRANPAGDGYVIKTVRAVGAANGAIDHVTATGSISTTDLSLKLSDGGQITASMPAGSPVGSFLPGTMTPADGSANRVISCNTDQEGPASPDRVWFLSFSPDTDGEHISLADGSYSAALVASIPLASGICAQAAGDAGAVVYTCSNPGSYSTVLTTDAAQANGKAVVTDAAGASYQFSCSRAHNGSIMHPGLLPVGTFNCDEASSN